MGGILPSRKRHAVRHLATTWHGPTRSNCLTGDMPTAAFIVAATRDKTNSTRSLAAINTASATDRFTHDVYLPQVREYRNHMAGMVSAGRYEMATQLECGAKWAALKADFLAQINDIDNETPWSNIEPKWWLEMMTAEKAVREGAQP